MTSLVTGRKVNHRDLALLPGACGRWLRKTYLEPTPIMNAGIFEDVVAGLYLITTEDDRILWLGHAHRDGGVAARLRRHLSISERIKVFRLVRVLQLDDFTPRSAVLAIEGKAADFLRLRKTLGSRQWPSSSGWDTLAGYV